MSAESSSSGTEDVAMEYDSYGKTPFRALNENIRLLVSPFEELAGTATVGFVCECAREDCFATVDLSLREYGAVCSDDAHRLIFPGHEHAREEVVVLTRRYAVVKLSGE